MCDKSGRIEIHSQQISERTLLGVHCLVHADILLYGPFVLLFRELDSGAWRNYGVALEA